jgi:hypothetical protein
MVFPPQHTEGLVGGNRDPELEDHYGETAVK